MASQSEERDAQFNALIDVLHSVKSDIFDPFTITRTYYESAGVQIGVDILIPRQLKTHNPPVVVRIHGGFLVCKPHFHIVKIQLTSLLDHRLKFVSCLVLQMGS